MMTEPEQLQLPIRWSVLAAMIVLVVLMLLAAGWVNHRRRASRLAAMEATDCAVVYPPELVERLKTLQSKGELTDKFAQSVAAEVQALYTRGRRAVVLFERGAAVWSISPLHDPRPDGKQELAAEWGDWPSLGDQEFCRGALRDKSFVVGRTVMLDSQQHVVVMTFQSIGKRKQWQRKTIN